MAPKTNNIDVLMVGTGEYTTGYVGGKAADSDKGAGVVALTMFDLRRRNKVDRVGMCGVNGKKISRYPTPLGKIYRRSLQRYGSNVRNISIR